MENANLFLSSLSELTPDDFGQKPKKKISVYNLIRYLVLAVCLCALAFSVSYIARSVADYRAAENEYNGASKMFEGGGLEQMYAQRPQLNTPDYEECQKGNIVIPTPRVVDRDFEKKRNELLALKEKYKNVYGWVTVPGTNIDYPIMQTTDNNYYLTHSFTDAYLMVGSIFADYRLSSHVTSNRNFILYGHHVSTELMFHALDRYLSEDFLKENDKVIIYTLDGKYTYKLISVYSTNMYYNYIQTNFPSGNAFVEFANEMFSNSIFENDVKVTEDDYMITLSTCSNREENGRLTVQGILIDVYE